jgi:hypothetical protein
MRFATLILAAIPTICAADSIQWSGIATSTIGGTFIDSTNSDGATGQAEVSANSNSGSLAFQTLLNFDVLQAGVYTVTESAKVDYYTWQCEWNGQCFPPVVEFTGDNGMTGHASYFTASNAIYPVEASATETETFQWNAGPHTLLGFINATGRPTANTNLLTGMETWTIVDPVSTPEPRWIAIFIIAGCFLLPRLRHWYRGTAPDRK